MALVSSQSFPQSVAEAQDAVHRGWNRLKDEANYVKLRAQLEYYRLQNDERAWAEIGEDKLRTGIEKTSYVVEQTVQGGRIVYEEDIIPKLREVREKSADVRERLGELVPGKREPMTSGIVYRWGGGVDAPDDTWPVYTGCSLHNPDGLETSLLAEGSDILPPHKAPCKNGRFYFDLDGRESGSTVTPVSTFGTNVFPIVYAQEVTPRSNAVNELWDSLKKEFGAGSTAAGGFGPLVAASNGGSPWDSEHNVRLAIVGTCCAVFGLWKAALSPTVIRNAWTRERFQGWCCKHLLFSRQHFATFPQNLYTPITAVFSHQMAMHFALNVGAFWILSDFMIRHANVFDAVAARKNRAAEWNERRIRESECVMEEEKRNQVAAIPEGEKSDYAHH